MNKLILVDSDGLTFHSERPTLQESIQVLDEKIQNMFVKTEATHYVFFISNGKYFRHQIDPCYKQSRDKYRSKTKWTKVLKQYLAAQYNAQYMDGVEADDLCAYWINTSIYFGKFTNPHSDNHWDFCKYEQAHNYSDEYQQVEKIICSPDKDILSLEGRHFNYSYKLENKDNPNSVIKGWWVTTDKSYSELNFWYSMICGDSSDGVKGIEGKGQSYADKIFSGTSTTEWFSTITLRAYIEKYGMSKGIYEFQKNYRLLHMLNCDEDFIREVGKIPEFPIISEVPKKIDIVEPNCEF